MDTVLNCLATDAVGPGEYLEKFEKGAKILFGFESAISVRSPYFALLSILGQLGLERGSNIGVSALAPVYHKRAVEDSGFIPIYIDTDPVTCVPLLDLHQIISAKAIILFDSLGILPSREVVSGLQIPIIEDMTQALGAHKGNIFAGALGNFSIYGMEYGSLVTAGGGAILFTSMKRESTILHSLAEKIPEELLMTDYNASLGLAQLREFETMRAKRKIVNEYFLKELFRSRHHTFEFSEDSENGYWAFPVIIESGMRDARVYARKNGVESEPAFDKSIVSMEEFPKDLYPGSHSLALRCLLFPLHSKMGEEQTKTVGRVLATLP
jgi:dTDP-4-amino-4,6-dideoxygalactose transaminase